MSAEHHEKNVVPAFFRVSIDQLSDNLESGKKNYCFGKKSGNNLDFGSKNLYKHWDIRIKKRWFPFWV